MSQGRYGIDLLVVGAGIVGAAVAHCAARAGLRVTVIDSGGIAGGATGAGEGNLLVSDKPSGPELDLALWSVRLWRDLVAGHGDDGWEYRAKGGVVVAADPVEWCRLQELAVAQRAAGVRVESVDPLEVEPRLRPGLTGAMFYPQDAQLMPPVVAAGLLSTPSITVRRGVTVTGALTSHRGRMIGVATTDGHYSCGTVVNATGARAAEVAAVLGSWLPVTPRRGFVLVTEPVPEVVRHKVYHAGYVDDVAADADTAGVSPVIEGTAAGPILVGASRQAVGFDAGTDVPVLRRLAAAAVDLFPVLGEVAVLRAYCGFRALTPDHLPIIGPDPVIAGLWHATGHEGAGVGLAAATGAMIVASVTGQRCPVDPAPFAPARFRGVDR